MRPMRAGLWIAVALLVAAGIASAQSTTGTVSGRVVDAQQLPVPGVTVNAESPNLQGIRTTVTSRNGDYILSLLPSGVYKLTFELSGLSRVERSVTVAPTQIVPVDAAMGPAGVAETINVAARSADVLIGTTQVATNFSQDLIATLPTNRDIHAALLLAPAVRPTGAGGGYSISGSLASENLFMVNGVSVTENLRGQPYDLYIEDAIQETTIATAGISAEYGRFSGGVVNVVTKSGGNLFSGSLRDTLHNDKWRAHSPFEDTSIAADPNHRDTRVDRIVPAYEFTFGGPAYRDRLWFFTAGRFQTQESARSLAVTNIPYLFTSRAHRYEVKGTYSLNGAHRLQGALIQSSEQQENQSQNPATAMDRNSLFDPTRLMNLFTVNYSGLLSPRVFLEARYSVRNETMKDVGARTRDLIAGTLLIDRNQRRYWAPTFCGVCDPEERDGQDLFVKGSYFLSTSGRGSHSMVFGYDGYNDKRLANNHQSGSDYRILGTTAIIRGAGESAVIYPQFLPDGATVIAWQPILVGSEGSDFRTHSLFFSDNWRVSAGVTANLGLRYDRNHGANGIGDVVTKDSAWSPRLGMVWDPAGDQKWAITGSVGKYVAAIANTIADASSPGGNFDAYAFAYRGQAINADPNGPLLPTDAALRQVFAWFESAGGASLPQALPATVRGVTPQIRDSLASPNVMEYATGVSRQFGSRGAIRIDGTYRDYGNFYAQRTDLSTGRVTDNRSIDIPPEVRGRVYDLTLIENTDVLKRTYLGVTAQAQYRIGVIADVGGTYTLSRLSGNGDGENANSGPTAADVLQYPEYKQASWNYPDGNLTGDQRHRGRLWFNVRVPQVSALTVSALQIIESGVPYGAVGTINVQPYVTNPGYLTPPSATNLLTYYYTARDAFRTEGQRRTDVAATYARRLGGARRVELFGQFQVLNVLDQSQLCACGATTVFQNGGAIVSSRIDQTVRSAVTAPTLYLPFDPFSATPQEAVHWAKGQNFGKALNRFAHTTPRTYRISFGVRF